MDKIADWLKAYIDAHPLDFGDSDCDTVLNQLYQVYAEFHESDPPEINNRFKKSENIFEIRHWMITMRFSTYTVSCAVLTSEKNILTNF